MSKCILIVLLLTGTCRLNGIYDFSVGAANGDTINFSQYQGKRILIVNTATNSTYAGQLNELQQLYQQHNNDLVIIAFPSNSFGNEPRSNQELQNYLSSTYQVSFPVAAAVNVTDSAASIHPLYQWLTKKDQNGVIGSSIKTDFQKYLVNRQGKIVGVFNAETSPLSDVIQTALQIHQ